MKLHFTYDELFGTAGWSWATENPTVFYLTYKTPMPQLRAMFNRLNDVVVT